MYSLTGTHSLMLNISRHERNEFYAYFQRSKITTNDLSNYVPDYNGITLHSGWVDLSAQIDYTGTSH